MFNPDRLTLARKRRRLSGKELADKAGLSPVTISRLGKANNEPEAETVTALSNVLGFPLDFFYGDDIDDLNKDAASFRSLTSMTARERDAALSSGSLAYLLSDWITEKFNLPDPDIIDLGYEADATRAARTLRQFWGLGERPVGKIIKLLESKGVRIFSLSENTKSVDAFSCWRNETPYIFLNTFKSAERRRFDAAHELAHLVLHRHGGPHQRAAEIEANNFASSFLMPRSDVLSKTPFVTSIDYLIRAKRRWGVSILALTYRLHKLKILSDWQYRTFCIQISQRYVTDEPNSIEREESAVWKQVFSKLWNERVTKNHIANDLHIPINEIENLVYGLIGDPIKQTESRKDQESKPELKIV